MVHSFCSPPVVQSIQACLCLPTARVSWWRTRLDFCLTLHPPGWSAYRAFPGPPFCTSGALVSSHDGAVRINELSLNLTQHISHSLKLGKDSVQNTCLTPSVQA